MKRYLPHGLFALLVAGIAIANAQSINKSFQLSQDPTGVFNTDTQNNAYFPGHFNTTGPTGTLSSCGTVVAGVVPSQVGSDLSGTIQTGTGTTTACTLTFRTAYVSTPFCVANINSSNFAQNSATPVGIQATPQGVTFTYTAAPGGPLINYMCMGRSGG